MLKARDIMNGNVVSITKDIPLIEAAQVMASNDISGIPVVDDEMTLEGVVTEKDQITSELKIACRVVKRVE